MNVIPSSVWGRPDGNVRLWVPFNGNLSDDISGYAQGAGTNTGATITGGELALSGTTQQSIAWSAVGSMGRASGVAWTLEAFFTWTASDNSTNPGGIVSYVLSGGGSSTQQFMVYANTGKVALQQAAEGQVISSGNVLSGVGKVHVALVHPGGAGAQTLRLFVAGVQVQTQAEFAERVGTSGAVTIGKFPSGGTIGSTVTIDDVRLSHRVVYSGSDSGTTFTPPKSPL